jgi:hypothetical protein
MVSYLWSNPAIKSVEELEEEIKELAQKGNLVTYGMD